MPVQPTLYKSSRMRSLRATYTHPGLPCKRRKSALERGNDLDAFALLVHDLSDEKHVLIADLAGIAALVGVV